MLSLQLSRAVQLRSGMNRFRRQAGSSISLCLSFLVVSVGERLSYSLCPSCPRFSSGHGLYFYLPISYSLTALDQILMELQGISLTKAIAFAPSLSSKKPLLKLFENLLLL